MTQLPWDYFFDSFSNENFPDLWRPVLFASLALIAATVLVYAVQTRRLHRHRLYLDMWEWLLWTGIITFFLTLMGAIFVFDFIVELVILATGLGVLIWVRFVKYPPLFDAYDLQLAHQRYMARVKSSRPEATIRTKTSKRRKRR